MLDGCPRCAKSPNPYTRRIVSSVIACVLILATVLFQPVSAEQPNQSEQIGEVLGKPVYRDQIHAGNGDDLGDELHDLFMVPVMQKYCDAHKAEITPTEAEISLAAVALEKRYWEAKREDEPKCRRLLKEVQEKLANPKLPKDQRQGLETYRIVYRSELADERPKLREELKNIKERMSHAKLTKAEREHLEFVRGSIEASLHPVSRDTVHFIVDHWKLERHLYKKFGGGRLLFQQAGTEAFDAMKNWLQTHERAGSFKITDPKLRTEFYHYWNRSHGPFMIVDKQPIQDFLEPEWAPRKKQ
jgi:hypothetical protein